MMQEYKDLVIQAKNDSHSPKYQKFKIDELPKVISYQQDWNWKDLISYYQQRYHKTNAAVIRDLIANDGTFGSIHDEPDISFYTTDFDVGFISSKYLASSVVIVDNKGFDTHSGGFAVVSNALV